QGRAHRAADLCWRHPCRRLRRSVRAGAGRQAGRAAVSMKTALIQLCSGDDPVANLPVTTALINEAADSGAGFVLTPEVTNCVSSSRARQDMVLRPESEDITLAALSALAAQRGIWLLIGSLAIKTGDADGRF